MDNSRNSNSIVDAARHTFDTNDADITKCAITSKNVSNGNAASIITACALSNSSLDFDTATNVSNGNSKHSDKHSDAINDSSAGNTVHNNESEHECLHIAHVLPLEVPPVAAPPPHKPEELPPCV